MNNFDPTPVYRVIFNSDTDRTFFYETVLPRLHDQNFRVATVDDMRGHVLEKEHFPGNGLTRKNSISIAAWVEGQPGFQREIGLYCDLVFMLGEDSGAYTCIDEFPLSSFNGNGDNAIGYLLDRMGETLEKREVWACVLIGGQSSRMGQPKHLIRHKSGLTWLEENVRLLEHKVAGVVLSGRGNVPLSLKELVRIPDTPGVEGPLSGVISVMRWLPDVSWLILACDLPEVTPEAVDWLLQGRLPGQWAKIPRLEGRERGEPLLARYEPQCRPLFETMARSGHFSLHRIFRSDKVQVVQVPPSLQSCWNNVNTPQELEKLKRG